MKNLIVLILSLLTNLSYCQQSRQSIIGKYTNISSSTVLLLKSDSTFNISEPDPIFPYTFTTYKTHGVWSLSGNIVTLNPDKERRTPTIYLSEKTVGNTDSIFVKILYSIALYENEKLLSKEPSTCKLLTLYINKKKNYYHLVQSQIHRSCLFSQRVKKQRILDTSMSIHIPKTGKTKCLGLFTYGFDEPIELIPKDLSSNYFEISITQGIDKDRTPRNKKFIIKNGAAYYYKKNMRSLFLDAPALKRTKLISAET